MWTVRILVVFIIALMVIAFIMPWWKLSAHHIIAGKAGEVYIHSYGLRDTLIEGREWLKYDETPLYQTTLAWVFLFSSSVIIVLSTLLQGIRGPMLLGTVGFVYIMYGIITQIRLITRLNQLEIPLQGEIEIFYVDYQVPTTIVTNLLPYYSLVFVGGGLAIVLAVAWMAIIARKKYIGISS